MYAFLTPLAYLPLAELIGFIVIGGKIGFFMSMLWLFGATWLGFWLLRSGAALAFSKPRAEDEGEFFAAQSAFDSLCLLIAALLLIFPGFISDFIAIPFLVSPFRHWLFSRSKDNPDGFMRNFTKQSRGFREWTYEKTGHAKTTTIIEGEYTRVDDTEHLPKQ